MNSPTTISTRSVVRRNMFARAIAVSSPLKKTLPSSTRVISSPRSDISLFSTASSPKWQGHTRLNCINTSVSFLYLLYLNRKIQILRYIDHS